MEDIFKVQVPVTAKQNVIVVAESEEHAKELAKEKFKYQIKKEGAYDLEVDLDESREDEYEISTY